MTAARSGTLHSGITPVNNRNTRGFRKKGEWEAALPLQQCKNPTHSALTEVNGFSSKKKVKHRRGLKNGQRHYPEVFHTSQKGIHLSTLSPHLPLPRANTQSESVNWKLNSTSGLWQAQSQCPDA